MKFSVVLETTQALLNKKISVDEYNAILFADNVKRNTHDNPTKSQKLQST